MRSRYLLPVGALLGAAAALPFAFPRFILRASADPFATSDSWHPTLLEIERSVGMTGPGKYDDDRHLAFAQMFQGRYRHHEDQAFGVKFDGEHDLRLMGGSQIPRWQLARVAMELRREAKTVFGTDYDVDIFETFISMPEIGRAHV